LRSTFKGLDRTVGKEYSELNSVKTTLTTLDAIVNTLKNNESKYALQAELTPVVSTLNNREEGVLGVQWIIDREGRVFRGLPAGSKGSHIKSGSYLTNTAPRDISNETTQGVEIIAKNDKDVLPLQCFSAFKLVKDLGYPLGNIYGHGEINNHKANTEGQKCKTFIKDNWDLSIDEVAKKVENI